MPDQQQPASSYDPIKDANRDSQTLPTFDNSKFVEKKRVIQIDGKTVIINNSFSYQSLPEVEVFSHENFNLLPKERPQDGYYLGEKLQSLRTTFNIDLDKHPLDEKISSIIVHSGYWKFFNKKGEEIPVILGPGRYEQVQKNLIPNDNISRFESVDMDL